MNHRERFYATINHHPVDRPASWLGLPVTSAIPGLLKYFDVDNIDNLLNLFDDDIYPIKVPYNYPPSNHIACAFRFAKISHLDKPDERTLTASGFFEDYNDPADVEKFSSFKTAKVHWPINLSTPTIRCRKSPGKKSNHCLNENPLYQSVQPPVFSRCRV